MGCEDRYGVRSDSGHENHEHLTSAGGQNHQRDLEIAYLTVSVPGSFKHSEARGKIPTPPSRKPSPRAPWKVKLRHCPVAPISSRMKVNDHWNLSQSHGLNHRSGTQSTAKISLFVLESVFSNIFPALPTALSFCSFLPSYTHTQTRTHTPDARSPPRSTLRVPSRKASSAG